MMNKEHFQLAPPSFHDMVDWVKKAFNYILNDTEMVSMSFDVCGYHYRFLKDPKRIPLQKLHGKWEQAPSA